MSCVWHVFVTGAMDVESVVACLHGVAAGELYTHATMWCVNAFEDKGAGVGADAALIANTAVDVLSDDEFAMYTTKFATIRGVLQFIDALGPEALDPAGTKPDMLLFALVIRYAERPASAPSSRDILDVIQDVLAFKCGSGPAPVLRETLLGIEQAGDVPLFEAVLALPLAAVDTSGVFADLFNNGDLSPTAETCLDILAVDPRFDAEGTHASVKASVAADFKAHRISPTRARAALQLLERWSPARVAEMRRWS